MANKKECVRKTKSAASLNAAEKASAALGIYYSGTVVAFVPIKSI